MNAKSTTSGKTLYLSLPEATYERVKERALAEGMSVTAWIRRALGDKPKRRYRVKNASFVSNTNAE